MGRPEKITSALLDASSLLGVVTGEETFACLKPLLAAVDRDESFSGWACSKCCYDGEYPLECCDHGSANHSGIDFDHACRTRAILMGAEDND